MPLVTLALHAMATRFEVVLAGDDPVRLRAAGEEALREVERLEARLSLFRPGSEISDLNTRAAQEPVRVAPDLFALLALAQELTQGTQGAFDITVAPLVRCWGFMGGSGRMPPAEEIAEARARVGMHLVELDAAARTVRFARPGVMLDLGAIGKGYAVDQAVEILREAGVESALVHGGTSTVYGLGRPPEGEAWMVAVEESGGEGREPGHRQPSQQVALRDRALSVSAVWGKSFQAEGKVLGHVLDPRLGQPVTGAKMAAVVLPSATETDALSTALLVLGKAGQEQIQALRPGMGCVVQGT
jgi:thiamine biosynthesis lipoprotein